MKLWLKENLLALPRLALLIPKLIGDERVPTRTKLVLAGLGVYIVSPWDLIPDFIPVLGQLDDLVALLLLLDGVLNQIDDAILLEHWRGDVKTLRRLQWLARRAAALVPGRLQQFLFARARAAGARQSPAAPISTTARVVPDDDRRRWTN